MVRTFQINQLFDSMTPLETLALVVSQQQGLGAHCWQPLGASKPVAERALQLLEQFRLTEVMNQRTEHLAYGKRRLLEIAIALACEPRVLLLDEPVAGVPAGEREELLQTVAALPADVSVLLIEHDMDLVFSFANRMTVLVNGARADRGRSRGDRQRSAGQGGVPGPRREQAAMAMAELLQGREPERRLRRGRGPARTCRCRWTRARRWRCWDATAPARPR